MSMQGSLGPREGGTNPAQDDVPNWNDLPLGVIEEIGSKFTGQDWLEKRHISRWWRTALSARVKLVRLFPHNVRDAETTRQLTEKLLNGFQALDTVLIYTDANLDPSQSSRHALDHKSGSRMCVLGGMLRLAGLTCSRAVWHAVSSSCSRSAPMPQVHGPCFMLACNARDMLCPHAVWRTRASCCGYWGHMRASRI